MSTIDLALRYAIITLAFQLACAWAHTFQSPWPLADAFELAPTAKDQLFKSLGVRFDASIAGECHGLADLRFGHALSDDLFARDTIFARSGTSMKAMHPITSTRFRNGQEGRHRHRLFPQLNARFKHIQTKLNLALHFHSKGKRFLSIPG